MTKAKTRTLVLVLGDQLDENAAIWDDFAPDRDRILMAEVREESTHVCSSRIRIVLFLSAMRHFAAKLRTKWGQVMDYHRIDQDDPMDSLAQAIETSIADLKPERIHCTETGDHRVETALREVAESHEIPLEWLPDRHFFATREDFAQHAKGRKQIRLEFFYRELRKREQILVDQSGDPEGGQWNFDAANRGSFGKSGPDDLKAPLEYKPDKTTREVIAAVEKIFKDHPGELTAFDWPVTRRESLRCLEDFIENRLPQFGRYQDAMWENEPWLYHSRLSSALNLKLLNPREVVAAAVEAYRNGHAPLEAVEGFVRQILGWREYVRGLYWLDMPDYREANAMNATEALPEFYWNGDCEMRCLQQAIGQTLQFGYAHHIQRLMVTGLYSLLLGVVPKQVHEWYLAVYVDAVEWVELPNTIGMSQYADGGRMASKPYVATGAYIQRMSNHCSRCRFDPKKSVGDDACPFTTLYWDYLLRHEDRLKSNLRMSLQLRNLKRWDEGRRNEVRTQAQAIRQNRGQPAAKAN
ncbi:MAG: cryptochrome/photolyase family protein [Synoicihabitans sp.]